MRTQVQLRWSEFSESYVATNDASLDPIIGYYDSLEDAFKSLHNMGYEPILIS